MITQGSYEIFSSSKDENFCVFYTFFKLAQKKLNIEFVRIRSVHVTEFKNIKFLTFF